MSVSMAVSAKSRIATQGKYMAQTATQQGLSGIKAVTGQIDRSLVPPPKPVHVYIHAQRIEEATKLFRELDVDNSGTLDKYEVGSVLEKLGIKQTGAQLDAQMSQIDTDGDGCVNLEEFKQWWAAAARSRSNQTVSAMLDTLAFLHTREEERALDALSGQTDIFGNERLIGGGTKGSKKLGSFCTTVSASCDAILLVIIGCHVAALVTMIIATIVEN